MASTFSPSTYVYRAWLWAQREGSLADLGYTQAKISPTINTLTGHERTPDLIISGWLAPTCLVIEIKDANDIHDCDQARDMSRLDPTSLSREVHVGNSTDYRPLFSCPVAKARMLNDGLEECGIEKMAVVAVHSSVIRKESGEVGEPQVDRILEEGIPLPSPDPEKLPAEYFPFCPEAPDWEIARWLIRAIIQFALQDHPPFTYADLAEAACGSSWSLMAKTARTEIEASIKRLVDESKSLYLSNAFINSWWTVRTQSGGRAGYQWFEEGV